MEKALTFRSSAAFDPQELERWGTAASVDLYLDRCQVATPEALVSKVWNLVHTRGRSIGTVLDFGAGDGRFAVGGQFNRYVGYEIDPDRWRGAKLPARAELIHRCAFRGRLASASLAIGNPPYVRNQDLPAGWRERAAQVVRERTGVSLSGLANAWQYFFFLALAATSRRGLIALIVPYEWVSRPSSMALRDYVGRNKWDVSVYRLPEKVFGDDVLTTASITLIDKLSRNGVWRYFKEDGTATKELKFAGGNRAKVLPYERRSSESPRAVRGLSPGTQDVFVLTDARRAELGLHIGRDVVRCVTSLRHLPASSATLNKAAFDRWPATNVGPMSVRVFSLAVFHCKLNRCLTSCGVGIAANRLKCKSFSALVLGSQVPGAGGLFPIDWCGRSVLK